MERKADMQRIAVARKRNMGDPPGVSFSMIAAGLGQWAQFTHRRSARTLECKGRCRTQVLYIHQNCCTVRRDRNTRACRLRTPANTKPAKEEPRRRRSHDCERGTQS